MHFRYFPFFCLLSVAAPGAALAVQAEPPAAPAPFQPKIEDPMLTPAPAAARQVSNWDEALKMLRERSSDLRIAQFNVQRAEGLWRQALSALLPTARLAGGVGHDFLNPDVPVLATSGSPLLGQGGGTGDDAPSSPLLSGSISLTQSLVNVSAWRGLSAAGSSEEGARSNLQDVQRRLTLGLAQTLVATVAAERTAELNRVGLRQALERAALTQRSFELGAGTQLDVVRVRQDVEVARASLISGDEQLRRTREALGLTLGLPEAVGVQTTFQLQGLVEQTRDECAPLKALSERPDIVAARAQAAAARDSRRQASAGYLPTLGLTSNVLGYTTDPGFGTVPTWSISAVLSLPIWEGGLREGLVRERAALEAQSAETLLRTGREVEVEVARARRGVEVAETLVKTSAAALELAERTDNLTRRAFEVGRGSSLELVQSGAALRQAQLALALREFELVQSRLSAFLTEARCDW
jgi:outer membrane protein TolC